MWEGEYWREQKDKEGRMRGEEGRGKTREGRVRKGYIEEIGERWELERKDEEGVTRQGRRILEYVSLASNPTSL